MRRRTRRVVDYVFNAMGITLVAVLMSSFLIYDLSSFSVFAPMKKAMDFKLSDFYNSALDARLVAEVDTNIVIVSVDGCTRNEVTRVIETLDYLEPAAMALDVFFMYESVDGEELKEAMMEIDNLVLPYSVRYDEETETFSRDRMSFFDTEMTGKHYGIVNLSASSTRDVVRKFKPYFEVGGCSINNFMVEVAEIVAPEKVAILKKRCSDSEIIYYPSVEFNEIKAAELIGEEVDLETLYEQITGRVVLIGTLKDKMDFHITPTDAEMSGLMIHAHTLDTILNERYITSTPEVVNWAIAIVVSVLFNMWSLFAKRRLKIGNIVNRVTQISLLALFALLGTLWYADHAQYVDFSVALLMIGLRPMATDVWSLAVLPLSWIKEKYSTKKNKL